MEVDGEEVEEVFFNHTRHQLVDLLRIRFGLCWAVSGGVGRRRRVPRGSDAPCVPCRTCFICARTFASSSAWTGSQRDGWRRTAGGVSCC